MFNGFGLSGGASYGLPSDFDPEALLKALVTNQYSGQDPFVDPNSSIGAFQPEDLEPLLTMQTARLNELKLWKWIHKEGKRNLVWQYNKETSIGSDYFTSFVTEGQVGNQQVSAWTRMSRIIKFLSEWGMYSLQSTMLALGGNSPPEGYMEGRTIETKAVNDRIRHLLIQLEKSMFWANTDIQGNKSFDGIVQQMVRAAATDPKVAAQIIDLHGQPLDREAINLGTQQAVENHLVIKEGSSNVVMMCPPGVITGYSQTLTSKERTQIRVVNEAGQKLVTGTPVAGHMTDFGYIPFEHNIFMNRDEVDGASAGVPSTNRGAPGATLGSPATVTTGNAGASAVSLFYSDDAGTYYYTVTSIDDGGEKATGTVGAGVLVAAGESVTVTIADPGSGATPTGYRIYRGRKADLSDKKFVVAIARDGVSTVYTDTNYWMAGCDLAIQICNDPETMELAQLGPLMKMNLPFFGLGRAFAVFLFLDLAIKDHRKFVIYRNIARPSDSYVSELQAA